MIVSTLEKAYPLNEQQRAIVAHKQGPLLVIAGPGSGKTQSLTLRAMNLLLSDAAQPRELVLCTYTEKAAHEMQDRIIDMARKTAYSGDLSGLKIGTIHSLCSQLIRKHLRYTPLDENYIQLDEFSQQLLIFEQLDEICVFGMQTFFQELWGGRWSVAKKLQYFFDKIAEELIFEKLKAMFPYIKRYPSEHELLQCFLTHAYGRYQKLLRRTNRIDFAHLQKCAYTLLTSAETRSLVSRDIRYVLVDEYQDTNYIQDQILLTLAQATGENNICVVGDEDQALYRFRGASVRNILEFEQKFPGCQKIMLTVNYRSHKKIIDFCNHWITSTNWSRSKTERTTFRTDKTICHVANRGYDEYPSVFSVLTEDAYREAEQFAEIIYRLRQEGKIHDYNEVALLLYSVQGEMSSPYVDALKAKGIPSFCPRARMLFAQEEVRLMVGCFSAILAYQAGEQRAERTNSVVEHTTLSAYVQDCESQLLQYYTQAPALEQVIYIIKNEIFYAEEQGPEKRLLDYFYRLLFTEPFATLLGEQGRLDNLVIFSQLLQTFQGHYRHDTITRDSLRSICANFFDTFLSILYTDGVNQYENPQQPFPAGHVQIMTIHQAKGLEFPVIAVGHLDKRPPRPDTKDKCLQPLYHLGLFEPEQHIAAFDIRRLYYVAFSRAKNILILMAGGKPDAHFAQSLRRIPRWHAIGDGLKQLSAPGGRRRYAVLKPRYSFTSHIQMYETCPRQFQFFRDYNFTPAHAVEAFFGLLVHQTLQKIHQAALVGQHNLLDAYRLREMFERTFASLKLTGIQIIDGAKKEEAWQQVLNYFQYNYQDLHRTQAVEMDIQVEQEHYVLAGKIDLLRHANDGMEIVDFKTRSKPATESSQFFLYRQQLYLYAYALQKHTGQLPQHLFLYWMAESNKTDALMEIPYTPAHIEQVHTDLDRIAGRIRRKEFTVKQLPAKEVCKTCDIRYLCRREGLL